MSNSIDPNQDTVRVQLNYPLKVVGQPIVFRLVAEFAIVPNILRARIDVHTGGSLYLELTGSRENLDSALAWLQSIGITVDAIGLDGAQEWAV